MEVPSPGESITEVEDSGYGGGWRIMLKKIRL